MSCIITIMRFVTLSVIRLTDSSPSSIAPKKCLLAEAPKSGHHQWLPRLLSFQVPSHARVVQLMFIMLALVYFSSLVTLAVLQEPTLLDSGCPEDQVTCLYTLIHIILFLLYKQTKMCV